MIKDWDGELLRPNFEKGDFLLHYNKNGEPCGIVTNIQKYTIHDGPGIRTEIFFKGCTMHCLWCSNPETILLAREFGVYPAKCLTTAKCGYCLKACPAGASGPLRFDDEGLISAVDTADMCKNCFKCADMCPSRAIKIWGDEMTVPELMKVIVEDRSFYQKTNGGVTLNGGEVMAQWEFAAMLLEECKKASIHTCVETALNCPMEHMEAVFKFTDLVITDIKHMSPDKHKEITGSTNEQILKNIRRAHELGKKLVIRTPVVPGYNGDEQTIREIGAFIKYELGGDIVQYQLLPYRKMGTEKYDSLNRPYPMGDYAPPERAVWEQNLKNLEAMLRTEFNIPAVAGSSQKLEM